MKIGIVSDTHGFFDPRLPEVLAGAEVILHAGDVGSQQVLDELATALGQYEDTLQATSAGRREHVGARADLKVVAADISKQLRLLDKVVRYRFGDNAELMGAWESARNVAGSFQTKNEPESGAGGSETPKAA